jgi:hypothetical protein
MQGTNLLHIVAANNPTTFSSKKIIGYTQNSMLEDVELQHKAHRSSCKKLSYVQVTSVHYLFILTYRGALCCTAKSPLREIHIIGYMMA